MSDYPIVPFYGYRVIYPDSMDRASYRAEIYSLQVVFPEHFRVMNLLPVLAFTDDCTPKEYERLDRLSQLWIGFVPDDLEQVTRLSEELTDFLRNNTMVNWIRFNKVGFTAGSEWFDDEEEESEESEDSEEESQEEEDSEEEEESEEEDYDSDDWEEYEEEDEESEKIDTPDEIESKPNTRDSS
jgi:phosphopantothenoylcysteine synthetase/decarboxylase